MKILLDENLPVRLKKDFGDKHIVFTMRDMKWLGKKNGEVLELMVLNDFELLVTSDTNLQFQQNLSKFPVLVAALQCVTNKYESLKPLIQLLLIRLDTSVTEKIIIVNAIVK